MDQVEAYQIAFQKKFDAKSQVEKVISKAQDLLVALRGNAWRYANVLGTPMPDSNLKNTAVDLSQWPTAEQIRGAISTFHQAQAEAQKLWNDLPQNRQMGLSPPSN